MKLDFFCFIEVNEFDRDSILICLHDGVSDKFVRVTCDLKSKQEAVDISVDNFPFNDQIAYREQLYVDSDTVCIVDECYDIDVEIGAQIELTDEQIKKVNEFLEGVEYE